MGTEPRLATVECPQCSTRLSVPADAEDLRRFTCGKCKTVFTKAEAAQRANTSSQATAGAVGVCIMIAIGFIMTLQPVSLLTGSGMIWTGVAVAGGGTALGFFLRTAVWVRVVAAIVLAFAFLNAFYIEHQLSDKRSEIGRMMNH